MSDHLEHLLHTAQSSDAPAGQQRIEEITQQLRDLDADLTDLARASADKFESLYNAGEFDLDQADTLYALADLADAISTVRTEQHQAQQHREAADTLAERVRTATEDTTQEPENTAEPEPHQPEPEPEFPAETPSDDPATSEEAEPVAATARPSTAAAVRNANPAPTTTTPAAGSAPLRSLSLTAAADVPDVPHRKALDLREGGQALLSCLRDMPPDGAPAPAGKKGIVNLHRNFDESLIASGDDNIAEADALLERITDETRLPGGSLVAAAKQQHDAITAAGTLPTPPGDIWCSPSTQDYSLCPALASASEGIWDGPTFTVRRGGIRYTTWPQYPDQHRPLEHRQVPNSNGWADNDQNQGWPRDNQGVAADDDLTSQPPRHDWHGYVVPYEHGLDDPDHFLREPKKFIEGPCPSWREERMNLAYMWVRADRLRDHTYPEVGERFLSDALVSHRRFMNETYIRWIYHHSDRLAAFDAGTPSQFGPAATIPPGPSSPPGPSYPDRHQAPRSWYETTNEYWPGGPKDISSLATFAMGSASEAILERLGMLVTWFRNTYRTSMGYSLEGFAPYWLKEFLKLDLERKSNRPHNLPVTDAEVNAVFLQWGVRLQWLYDFQDFPSRETGDLELKDRRVMPPEGWPNSCDIVLYPAGAWALAQDQILRISGEQAMDTRELRTNKYTRLFMEDSWMLLNKCQRSFVVRLTNLCQNGAVGAQREVCTAGTTVQSVAVTNVPNPAEVQVGQTINLGAEATMGEGTHNVTANATWKSSDSSIATVSGGAVTGVKAGGPVNITATYGGKSGTASITVKAAPAQQSEDKPSGNRKS